MVFVSKTMINPLNFFLFTLGLAFSLSSFSFKIALALNTLKASLKLTTFILLLYSGLFMITTLTIKSFLSFVEPLFTKAFYFHIFTALGLMLWGVYFLIIKNPKPSSKILSLLLIPCPVCLSAMSLSSYFFLKSFSFPPIWGGLILGCIFSILTLFFYFLSSKFLFKKLTETLSRSLLGLLMIAIGFYLIGSFYFPSKIEEIKTAGGDMNFVFLLENFLYLIASSLFVPVLLGLISLVFWTVYQLGAFLREFVERKKSEDPFLQNFKEKLVKIEKNFSYEVFETEVEKLLQESELKLLKRVDQIRFVIRVGPALGLLGTLIPMGIALAELAKGNLPKMAGHMVTAFTTTVVGLACGIVAYLITLVKERWIRETIKEMNYLAEMVLLKKSYFKEELYEEIFKKKKTL